MFRIDHAASSRIAEPLLGNWDVFLGILNVEAEGGVSSARLREILYGPPDPAEPYDRVPGMIHSQVLSPLCAMGLLVEGEKKTRQAFDERQYVKTPLWAAALRFSFERQRARPDFH